MLYEVSTIMIVVYLTEHAKSQAPSPESDILFNLHSYCLLTLINSPLLALFFAIYTICSRLVELALFIKENKLELELRSKNWLETKEKDTYNNDTFRHTESVVRISITQAESFLRQKS